MDWRAALVALYSEHAPQKLPKVDRVLEKYAGQEEEMYAAFAAKYGAPPLRSIAQPPDYKALLTALYMKHAKHKLQKIDQVLEKYAGQEAEMYAAFLKKYEGASAGGAPKAASEVASNLTRLQAFYATHNPSKVDSCSEILQKYAGREEALFAKLETKYAQHSERDAALARLQAIYRQHNPAKLPSAAALLAKYEGREEELFAALKQKYGSEAGEGDTAPPIVPTRPAPPQRVPPGMPAPLDDAKVAKLEAIYRAHNPAKVPKARALLRQWEGRESELFRQLAIKYPGAKSAGAVAVATAKAKAKPRDPSTIRKTSDGLSAQLGIGGDDGFGEEFDPTSIEEGAFFADMSGATTDDSRSGLDVGLFGANAAVRAGGASDERLSSDFFGSSDAGAGAAASTGGRGGQRSIGVRATHSAGRAFDVEVERRAGGGDDDDDVDLAAMVADRQLGGLAYATYDLHSFLLFASILLFAHTILLFAQVRPRRRGRSLRRRGDGGGGGGEAEEGCCGASRPRRCALRRARRGGRNQREEEEEEDEDEDEDEDGGKRRRCGPLR
jgi:hypothetical protein